MKKREKPRKSLTLPRNPLTLPFWAIPGLLAVGVLIFYWTPMTSPSTSIQWDAVDVHYSFQKYFADRLISGKIPFWTPYLFSGFPFLANPEVAPWYLPHWPFFLVGITPLSIQLELILHAFLACLGTYLLLSRLLSDRGAALVGAFAYGLSGFFAGHSSHVGLFSAAAWFPWLLLAYRCAVDGAALRNVALGGFVGGLMLLAGYFQTALYGFLGLGLYALSDIWVERSRRLRPARVVAGMLAGAIALAAIQILPGLELAAHAPRAGENYSIATEGVLHLGALMTLLAPDWYGAISGNYRGPADITQYYFYAGLLVAPLAVLGAIRSRLRVPALLIVILPSWYMCGPAGGFYRIAGVLPGLHKVRAPIQGWFVVALGLALLAAAGAHWVFERWNMTWVRIALGAVLFADLFYWNSSQNPLAYSRNSFAELYGGREQMMREHVAAIQPPLTRFDAPPRLTSIGPLNGPLDLKLEGTYGYISLERRIYAEYFVAMARNLKLRNGLNVSRSLNIQTGNVDPNPAVLPRAYFPKTIRDVVSEAESLKALEVLDPSGQSTAFVPHAPVQQDSAATAMVVSSDEQGYRVRYQSATPGMLKLSVAWYPGWHAVLGGSDLPIVRIDHALMGVVVPSGAGEVDFRFRLNYFAAGLAITVAATLGLGLAASKR